MRGCRIALIALFLGPLEAGRAQAVPPPGAAVGGANAAVGGANAFEAEHWIDHRVIMGERLAHIAKRYRVEIADVVEWNGLDPDKPMLKAGQRLRILTAESAAERRRRTYVVREGDTWQKIANRFDVGLARLRSQWNPGIEELLPGEKIVLFIEVEPQANADDSDDADTSDDDAPTPAPAPAPPKAATLKTASSAAAKPAASKSKPAQTRPAPAAAVQSQPMVITEAEALAAVVEPRPSTTTPSPGRASAKPTASVASSVAPPAKVLPAKPAPAPPLPPSAKSQPVAKLQPAAAMQPSAKTQSGPWVQPNKLAPAPNVKPDPGSSELPIMPVPSGAQSAGGPTRGRLIRGVQLPANEALYTIRTPENTWGSSHAIEQLQLAIARFRQDSGFDREVLICDMSRQRGGRFRPHHSHTSGRDVDIQLPAKRGLPPGLVPRMISAVDWDATWALVRAFVASGEVKYIFLSRSRQRPLYQAALRAGETKESLVDFIQFPDKSKTALLRHSAGHVKHLHVRFKCAADEARCADP